MYLNKKALHLLIGFFLFFAFSIGAQDQKVADSLVRVYQENRLGGTAKLELLRNLSFNEINDLHQAIDYAEELIHLAKAQENYLYLYRGYFQKGNKKRKLGNLDEALKAFFNAMDAAKKAEFITGEGSTYGAIADIYKISKNHSNAILYYNESIAILRQSGDSIMLAAAISNAGDAYLMNKDYDLALDYFEESGLIFDIVNYRIGKAYSLGNIGMVHANLGENNLAEENINEAIEILEESEDYLPICFYLITMSEIYEKKRETNTALNYASRSLQLAQIHALKQQVSDAHQKLSSLYEKKGDTHLSLEHYKGYIAYRDSVNNIATVQSMADLRTDFEVNLREKEIDLLEERDQLNRMYMLIGIILLILAIVLLLYFRKRYLHTRLLSLNERKEHDEKVKGLMRSFETKALESMVQGKEDERKRLALELHNHFGSLLATIKVNLNGIDDSESSQHQTINTLVDQACADIRSMSHKLNMGVSENFGLVPALKELTNQLDQSGELKVEFKASICDGQLDSKCEIIIYRIVQELVSNVLKHAKATKLSVLLTCFEEDQLINIMVQDNGLGIQKNRKRKDLSGIGLVGLEKMVISQRGELTIDSNPESGTTISIDLPLVKAPELTDVIK